MIQQTPDTVEEGLWQGWHEEQRSKNVFREGKKSKGALEEDGLPSVHD